jgi:hypothetical protein
MNKHIRLIAIGLVLIGGLFVWDRNNSTVEVMGATVLNMEQIDQAGGPDQYAITVVTAQGDTLTLSGTENEPRFSEGDSICVQKVMRKTAPDEYRRAVSGTEC